MHNNNFINECTQSIDVFKNSIIRGPFKLCLDKELTADTELVVYCAAIYQGYLDACRTFEKSECRLSYNGQYDGNTIGLAEKIKIYLQEKNSEFNHDDLCRLLIGNENPMTYGHAQKIVNMSFKYLCCLKGAENYSDKFANCHMPLDSIMLEWIVRECETRQSKKVIVKSKIPAWSKLTKDEFISEDGKDTKYGYSFFVEMVNQIKADKAPLQLDFENWKKMQIRLSAESFLKILYQEEDDGESISKYSDELKKKPYYSVLAEVQDNCYEFPYLESYRLILKKIRCEDAENFAKIAQNENVQRYLPKFVIESESKNINDAIKIMETKFKNRESLHLGIFMKDNPDCLIGIAEIFHYRLEEKQVSIGYRIDEQHWGKGIATEVIQMITKFLFNETDVEKISASVIVGNTGSEKALEKTGFKKNIENVSEEWGHGMPVIVNKFILCKPKSGLIALK